MRVKRLQELLRKVDQLLELYGESTVDRVLDVFIRQAQEERKDKRNAKRRTPHGGKRPLSTDLVSLKRRIQRLGDDRRVIEELLKLGKNDLIAFAKFIDIKVDQRESKSAIARILVGHLGFQSLNRKIAQRSNVVEDE